MLKNITDILFTIFFEIRRQIMAGLPAVDVHFPFFIGIQSGNDVEQGGFAAAGFSGDDYEFPFVQGQVHLRYPAGDHAFTVIEFRNIF